MNRRPIEDLLATDTPAWQGLSTAIRTAKNHVQLLAPDGDTTPDLYSLQVTVRSTMGALVHQTGGLLIDHGWVRVVGGHSAALGRSLVTWNAACGITLDAGAPPLLLIADDVLGGHFALNGGALQGGVADVQCFAPDTLAWESVGRGYSDFIAFLLDGDVDGFYAGQRWPGWQADVAALPGDSAFFFYPPLWAKAEGEPPAPRLRRVVPLLEAVTFSHDAAKQLGGG